MCLPCILYRINALLLADEIRKEVAHDLGLGTTNIADKAFEWPILNFGWSLADVLKKSREAKLNASHLPTTIEAITEVSEESEETPPDAPQEKLKAEIVEEPKNDNDNDEKTANDLLEEADKKLKAEGFQIGTWSNEMAETIREEMMLDEDNWGLPPNVDLCSKDRSKYERKDPKILQCCCF